ncbi:non-ribosomal peptide synthetase [Paenibacillus thalictri]|uniref:Amino acid adenylation domain-containing protein n=1 Tax=Paenibacillus thalictri TaxID=2527873 RepID=A0A4Q9DNQ3_9BACL|nr:non-ribosomal peptide synthetase [Paenibacillus thalictri]TBL76113.1 amino acid adenylation domain-containing protein [Paenibacillus thalictri]
MSNRLNETATKYPREATIHGLFASQMDEYAAHTAVIDRGRAFTYSELNDRAMQIEQELRNRALKNEQLTGVFLDRSFDFIASELAVLKAGGAYVPLGPDLPEGRLRSLLRDSGITLVITSEEYHSRLAGYLGEIIVIDDGNIVGSARQHRVGTPAGIAAGLDWIRVDGTSAESGRGGISCGRELQRANELAATDTQASQAATSLAYVMFTSGSTGKPKGVMVEHRGVIRLVKQTNYITFAPGMDRMLQTGAPGFDASTFEIWGALLNGLTLVLEPQSTILDAEQLEVCLLQRGITILWLTAPLFHQLALERPSLFAPLHSLLVGGDVLRPDLIALVRRQHPQMRVVNGYGPTENTTFSTCYVIDRDHEDAIPIGYPISNSTAYIVDEAGQQVPDGTAGELWVGGDGVARGYLHEPELTAQKFAASPFCEGERLYKTGDLARRRPDGAIEFLGRADHQVKIRGYRIEIAEIEQHLLRIAGVKEAVVVVEGNGADKELHAYYSTGAGAEETLSADSVKQHLRRMLPDYMLPSRLIALDKMPLNTNGKIDRQSLPEAASSRTASGSASEPADEPQAADGGEESERERQLLTLWREVLQREDVGVQDSFFECGGHSIKAMMLVAKVRQLLGVPFSIKSLFQNPSVHASARLLAAQSEHPTDGQLLPLEPVGDKDVYPLSTAQTRLFLEHHLHQGSTAYNIPSIWQIDGPLDVERLRQAFRDVLERHGSLRTFFFLQDGEGRQQVRELMEPVLPIVGEDEAACFVRPFRLGEEPVIRAVLLRTGEQSHRLLLDVHHIACDGTSLATIMHDLAALYAGRQLSALRLTYTDYAEWERRYLASPAACADESYWMEQYREPVTPLRLPYDKSRTAQPTREAGRFAFQLDAVRSAQLTAWSHRHARTLFAGLFALYNLLLHRWTGQTDLVVGTVTASRHHPELQPNVGMFVSTLAVRSRMERDMSLQEWVRRIESQLMDAYEHDRYPFEALVRHVLQDQEREDSSLNPLLHTAFVWQNIGSRALVLPGLTVTPLPLPPQDAMFELLLEGEEVGGELYFCFDYAKALFTHETVEKLAANFVALIEWALAAEPACRTGSLALPYEADRLEWVRRVNDTATAYPRDKCIQELFEEQAWLYPNDPALIYGDEVVTYRALNRRADEVARLLRQLGVGTDRVVGVMLPRSVGCFVSILAILKAGGAYLSLDPELPVERLRYMLDDSAAVLVISSTRHAERLSSWHGRVVRMEEVGGEEGVNPIQPQPIDTALQPVPSSAASPTNLAYVMYTSGSTGLPKGVMIEHQGIVRLVRNTNHMTFEHGRDRVLQAVALNFDASKLEIWGALLNGCSLVLAEQEELLDAEKLKRVIERHSITMMVAATPLFHHLATQRADVFASLRCLLVGGDVMVPHIAADVLRSCPDLQLFNGYGPTENTTMSTCQLVEREYELAVPIGAPISNSTAYIVDEGGQLLGVGETGELWVGGDGVARGYLGKPELTAERFLDSPFRPGERLYKTGDLARWREDGSIEFFGRRDHQVKIRGYRIELMEIELRLVQHEAVQEAVVLVRGEGESRMLCAYFTARRDVPGEELQAYLLKFLPGYMVPPFYVQLQQMPLLSNGKVDRGALPEPEQGRAEVNLQAEGPRDETERQLLELWNEVLGTNSVAIDDNFFERGGHSLSAMKLVARANDAFGVQLPIRAVFDAPTVRRLAEVVRSQSASAPRIAEAAAQTGYPLTYAQRHMYIAQLQQPDACTYNMPMLWRYDPSVGGGAIDLAKLNAAFKTLTHRHAALRTSFHLQDGEPVQRVHDQVELSASAEQLASADELAFRLPEWVRPFDLEQAPLLQVKLVHAGDETYLFLDMHHIVSDAVSVDVILEEWAALYEGELLKTPPRPYADYTMWQKAQTDSPAFREQESYWLSQFESPLPPLELPLDQPRPERYSDEGARETVSLDVDTLRKLRAFAREHAVTPFALWISLYGVWLSKYAGQDDIAVGIPASDRQYGEFQETVGMFVSTLAIRSRPHSAKRFLAFAKETQEVLLQGLARQLYPFEELVKRVVPVREANRNPLFDTMLVSVDRRNGGRTGKGSLVPQRIALHKAKFDLLVEIEEQEEGADIHWEYKTSLFHDRTVRTMAETFLHVVRTALGDPELMLAEIGLVSEERKAELLAFNPLPQSYYRGQTVIQLLERSCVRFAAKDAVVHAGQTISYIELQQRSNRVARALVKRGIGPGKVAAFIGERSLTAIVAIIGIFKSGAVYLPIDRTVPVQRMTQILQDSEAAAAIVPPELQAGLESTMDGQLLELEELLLEPDASSVPYARSSDDLAYMIYTSGSTGRPKGVMIGERSFANAVEWHREFYRIGEGDHGTQYASLGFDASILEIFPYLIAGATLHIVPETIRLELDRLNAYYEEHGITVSFLPTPIAEAFMRLHNRSLRLLLTAGDKLNAFSPQRYEVYNNYGPTENTVVAACHLVTANEPNIPIGHPVSNSLLYVMDSHGQLRPIGLPGELCIAGVGLALGYWKLPEVTAKHFVPHPLDPSAKLYRTGDVARWRADGTLEFLGRMDDQVKIRGNRVELGEVEQIVSEYPGISQAVVIAVRNARGEQELCAFYVTDTELSREVWRVYCSARLPGYMIPSRFQHVTSIPLTTNGKIDRKRLLYLLPELPDVVQEEGEGTAAGTRDEWEALIMEAFREVLGGPVGLHDNFFEFGGDSMKAIRVIARLAQQLELSVNDLFERQTVAGLRAKLQEKAGEEREQAAAQAAPVRLSELKRELRTYRQRVIAETAAAAAAYAGAEVCTTVDAGASGADVGPDAFARRSALADGSADRWASEHVDHHMGAGAGEVVGTGKEASMTADPDRGAGDAADVSRFVGMYREVLLTGGTGYIGMHILHELLQETDCRLHLLVRASSKEAAAGIIGELWAFYFETPFASVQERVRFYAGDMTLERLGLSEDVYGELEDCIDCIIHSAAYTKHYGFARDFERSNVTGTVNMIRLAAEGRAKHLYYLSTLSVALGTTPERSGHIFSEYTVADGRASDNYYVQSKLEAEKRIWAHHQEGHGATIIRLGNIVFHSETGKFQRNIEDNAFYRLIRGLIHLRRMPDLPARSLDFSFVDCASRAVARIVAAGVPDAVIHVAHPHPISYRRLARLLNEAAQLEGDIQLQAVQEILREIAAASAGQVKSASQHSQGLEQVRLELEGETSSQSSPLLLCSTKSMLLLRRLNVEWPLVQREHIERMLEHCRQVGFL